MIDKFSTVYAGHVDLGDMGQQATPANERRYSNDLLASVFAKTEAIARCMDEHGYRTLWLAEHHFQHEGYECLPNILMVGVHLAHLTTRLRTGCGFNIAPMWHPLRLAEDYATADILTGGSVVFGVGRGYHSREVETFGAPMLLACTEQQHGHAPERDARAARLARQGGHALVRGEVARPRAPSPCPCATAP
jgi:alkanesulfonate monooxygenase SsuD/methylene tetrahydromethanopterin reductase-like flavin-dependent oxidoreductase (luciferase family)